MRLLLVLLGIFACGCYEGPTEGPARFEVSGEVLLNGQPVPMGTIHFEPDASQGNKGPMSIAEIVDGHYVTDAGKGIVGGPQKILVEAYDGKVEPGTSVTQGRPLPGSPFRTKADLPKEDTTYDLKLD